METTADAIRYRLDDPRDLCDALGYINGPVGRMWRPQTGRGVHIRCPWHDETTPSCSVTRGRDGGVRVKCFGCPATGDVFTLVAVANGLDVRRDFRDVLDLSADLAGLQRPERRGPGSRPGVVRAIERRPVPPPVERTDDGAIAQVAAVLSHVARAEDSPEALAYLASRGLDASEARDWYTLPTGAARDAVTEAILETVGAEVWQRSGLSSPLGGWSGAWAGARLVIPWRDPDGNVTTLQGRYMGRAADVQRFAFPRERSPLWPYGCDALRSVDESTAVAVCEAAIDAASLNVLSREAGANIVAVALPSVTAWDPKWFGVFARRRCIAALDNDRAGQRETPALVERLRAVAPPDGVLVRVPKGAKDWNEVLQARRAPAARQAAA